MITDSLISNVLLFSINQPEIQKMGVSWGTRFCGSKSVVFRIKNACNEVKLNNFKLHSCQILKSD